MESLKDQKKPNETMAYNGAKYSGGIEGRTGLKLATKVPYRLTVKFEVYYWQTRTSRLLIYWWRDFEYFLQLAISRL